MRLAAITPTRGDRRPFIEQCIKLMDQQTVKLDDHFIIDYEPINDRIDIVPRIRDGYETAFYYDYVFIIEDDDYYPPQYIEACINLIKQYKEPRIFGIPNSIYYNIMQQRFDIFEHPGRSSLFCTAIKGRLNFNWPKDEEKFLDLYLWKTFSGHNILHKLPPGQCPVGIKHGMGKTGGIGHRKDYLQKLDPAWKFLELYVQNKDDLEFYKSGIRGL